MEGRVKGMGASRVAFSMRIGGAERMGRRDSQEWDLWDARATEKGGNMAMTVSSVGPAGFGLAWRLASQW